MPVRRSLLPWLRVRSIAIAATLTTAGAAWARPELSAKVTAGAEPMGSACISCHDRIVNEFRANIHGKLGSYGAQADCATCHAGAAEHAQSGDPAKVTNLAKVDAEKGGETCLQCHGRDRVQLFWKGSIHEALGCATCHAIHGGHRKLLASADESGGCFSCHFDVRSDLLKRSKHPLRDSASTSLEGKMTCASCHNPHGARSRALIDAKSVNDKCYECHVEKKAPVLWEHSPVKEDCLTCHTAHGSSNDKMLTTKIPRLCQQCHMQGRHQSGALAQNSVFAFNRSCLNCHPQVHGSNNPSGTILQR